MKSDIKLQHAVHYTDVDYLPTLYKIGSNGKVCEWKIRVEGSTIITEWGAQGDKGQTTQDVIKEGKNQGRSNETTKEEQAIAEAKAKWQKRRDKEYRETIAEAKGMSSEKTAEAGGYLPMLAQKYTEQKKKVIWPVYTQAKLDGLRCISTCDDTGKVTLWFRSGKPVTTMGHIITELETIMEPGEIWDGELYSHSEDFNEICGAIRRDKNIDERAALKIEYWVYDTPRIGKFSEKDKFVARFGALTERVMKKLDKLTYLKRVETFQVNSEEEMMERYGEFMEQGFEGIMVRLADSFYEQKRSYGLLKYKQFDDDEFKIVGFNEGRGKLAGHVGNFVCQMKNGKTFEAKLKGIGVTDLLADYFKNPKLFMGKMLTVKFQGLSPDGIPRFPVGVILRFDKE